jgi:hypothetical protein
MPNAQHPLRREAPSTASCCQTAFLEAASAIAAAVIPGTDFIGSGATRFLCALGFRSDLVSRYEGKDEAEQSSPTGRSTARQSDHIHHSHILRKVKQILRKANQATDSNDEEQGQDGEIGF